MALLAEQLVDEWLNRNGFFTLRGVKRGNDEIDLLGIRSVQNQIEGWHVEVQVSFRPNSYFGKLSGAQQKATGVTGPANARKRSKELVEETITDWIEKKFNSEKKQAMREKCWRGIEWQHKLVHGEFKYEEEKQLLMQSKVELVPFSQVLNELCKINPDAMSGGAGTDIADIIRFYSKHPDRN